MDVLAEVPGALRDIRVGWQRREGWWALSRQAIKINYRRTTLGPIWISIQQIAFIMGISLLYSQLFKVKSADLVPLVAFGISFWALITSYLTSASSIFTQQSQAITSSTLPISFYVFSSVLQQLLTFLHSAVVLIPFAFIFGNLPRIICIITVPLSIVFATLNGFSVGLWLGPLSTRYRDISVSIPIFIQLAMFLSPIFWPPSLIEDRAWIISYNPFAWMIETFRSPILGGSIQTDLWVRLSIFTAANLIVGTFVLSHVRNKISYWI
ncbi:MAG: ABC transporter permease [Actinobacteria bacterium]|jgi:ABC-type polysaccharide/polyol phosphate export permease|nr:ABC transporter permease [Actinomycetota bacterium]